jgi:hypothetical protein
MPRQKPSSTSPAAGRDEPKRRRGGQELPDEVQDRPEQNAGYDAAVRGEGSGTPIEPLDEAGVLDIENRGADGDLEVIDRDRRP